MRTTGNVLDALLEQHAALRRQMQRCERLTGHAQLEAVDDLRLALDAHNRFEERVLRSVLCPANVEQMYLDHVSEHAALNAQLAAVTGDSLRAALGHLRAHLDTEEQHFVNPWVLD